MVSKMVKKQKPYINIGPGAFIQEELDERGWRQGDLADIIGMTQKTVNQIINNRQSITPETARLLSRAFGQSPEYWTNLDSIYRLQLLDESHKEKMAELKAMIYKYMPIQEMVKKKWICAQNNFNELIKDVMAFWSVADLSFDFFGSTLLPQFRKSSAYSNSFNDNYALCWYRMAQRCAKKFDSSEYDNTALESLANRLHEYTVMQDGITAFIQALENCGVKFFVLSHLQKTYTDGAAFLDGANPVIVYTKRYDRNDNFWFTIAHEIAHILKHLNTPSDFFIDNVEISGRESTTEQEADEYAAELLKIHKIMDIFDLDRNYIKQSKILATADYLKLHPGMIVGILQHNDLLAPNYYNKYKEKVSDQIPDRYNVENHLDEIKDCVD